MRRHVYAKTIYYRIYYDKSSLVSPAMRAMAEIYQGNVDTPLVNIYVT